MRNLSVFVGWCVCFCLCLSECVLGQETATVTVTASRDIFFKPTKLRLHVLTRAESREGENALQFLKDHQAEITNQLLANDEDKPAKIEFSKPVVNVGTPGIEDPHAARRIIRMQAAQLRNLNPQLGGMIPGVVLDEDAQLPVIYTAASYLTAEWKLPDEMDADAVLLASRLKAIVEERDFRGIKLKEELTDEEEKAIRQLQGNHFYSSTGGLPEVMLMYVGDANEAQEEEAIQEAFSQASKQAERLARAVGRELGGLRNIKVDQSSSQNAQSEAYAQALKQPSNELLGNDPNGIKRTIFLNAVYSLK